MTKEELSLRELLIPNQRRFFALMAKSAARLDYGWRCLQAQDTLVEVERHRDMRFRQPYSLPELFALLSAYPAHMSPGAWGVAPQQTPLHQVIRLAREGMREYGHRLDVLEQQVSQHSWERDQTDPAQGLQQRSEDAISECDSSYRERGRRDAEPSQLNERQIHHLFNELAIQRRLLNGRGFPYTVDVNEEQRRIYPGSELLTMYEVEAAWDDWKNEDGKQLF